MNFRSNHYVPMHFQGRVCLLHGQNKHTKFISIEVCLQLKVGESC
jgi:hypothetical protein